MMAFFGNRNVTTKSFPTLKHNTYLKAIHIFNACGIFADSVDCEKYSILDASYITFCFYLLILFYLHVSPIDSLLFTVLS